MIKYVIWDFNGTVLDDRELTLKLLNEILKNQEKPSLSMEQYLAVFGFPIGLLFKSWVTFERDSFAELADWFIKIFQPESLKLNLHEGVLTTLKELIKKGITNVCLSASKQSNLEEQLNHYQIRKYFKYVLGTDNIHALGKKTNGAEFLKINKINPKSCVLIGDTIEDYIIARELGVLPVLFSGGHQPKAKLLTKTKLVIDNISDLLTIIKNEGE